MPARRWGSATARRACGSGGCTPTSPATADYFLGPDAGWREALDFEGSSYVGAVGRIMRDLPFLDIAPDWTSLLGSRLLSVPGDRSSCSSTARAAACST